jgi:uncharacterized membrane protein
MIDDLLFALILVAALGCGVIAGVFFAFSAFVMAALARLPSPQGIAAMQSINIVVINPVFLGVFFGTAVLCVVLIVAATIAWGESYAVALVAGSALYLAGTIGVTMACNVPRNNALAAATPDGANGAGLWARYVAEWTAWNHVRTAAALLAAASFAIALSR